MTAASHGLDREVKHLESSFDKRGNATKAPGETVMTVAVVSRAWRKSGGPARLV